ncbi:hypothetical protein RRF57_000040 [Xylaria bambusicola]|uniref:Uncharacterized protein n=1 Tax=Xylaria bambusicola TaxID=326684 RepID=A0AAN7U952_9PEZI
MATAVKVKALVFDLGGVLLNWDRNKVSTLSSSQFLAIMSSTTWYDLDRGHVSLQIACIVGQHLIRRVSRR